jgi:hypothetical protein
MAKRGRMIDLDRWIDLLHQYLTPAMCRAAVRSTRVSERQRLWTLYALVQFWIAIVLHAPKALSQALADARDNDDSVYAAVPATPAAFFAEVFRRFTAAS